MSLRRHRGIVQEGLDETENPASALKALLQRDVNGDVADRDTLEGLYAIPMAIQGGLRKVRVSSSWTLVSAAIASPSS